MEKQIKKVDELLDKTKGFSAQQILQFTYSEFSGRIIFASSLGEEDQVLTDMISKIQPEIEIFTLDTGRLFAQTYELIAKTQKRYPMKFSIYYPQTEAVEKMVQDKGINLFYESVENRKLCCGIRKVEPLQRALKNVDAWITGLRRAQSITRSTLKPFEWDEQNHRIKINPLADWSLTQVEQYIKENKVDVNPLHKEGFRSIGCAPCTRAIKSGEDIRAGRWWWEQPEQKECGLHTRLKSK
ncbi:MAG: phosphoadenylyl-sulfate reductase [Candidatus Omnitrophica bacterium]|nr:phosphoadenylyl-sulfate reductase [Candidatus Omnitrophota bacterium]